MDICPITGKPCNKVKNIFVQQQVDGEVSQYECCNDCMGGINAPFVNNLLHTLGILNTMQRPQGVECTCGSSLQDLKRKGIGCPQCYITFGKDLVELIPRVQAGETEHKGKIPKPKDLESLKIGMKKAIQEERYEDAAKYRDKIKELEKSLNGN